MILFFREKYFVLWQHQDKFNQYFFLEKKREAIHFKCLPLILRSFFCRVCDIDDVAYDSFCLLQMCQDAVRACCEQTNTLTFSWNPHKVNKRERFPRNIHSMESFFFFWWMRRFRLSIAKSKRNKWAGHRFSWIEAKNWSNCSPYIRTKWECGWMVLEWNTKSGHITIHKKPSLIEKTRTKLNSDYNHWANQIWNRTERAYIYHLHWISYYFFYSFCAMMMIMTVSISSTISCQLEWTYNDRKKNATNNYDRLIFSSSPRYISLCFVMLTEKSSQWMVILPWNRRKQ